MRITEVGLRLLEDSDGLTRVWVSDRLARSLLPVLERSARPAFERGDCETASFAALRAVEIEERRISQLPNSFSVRC